MDGSRVAVVGASAGIGRGFAAAALERGARVVVSARRELPLTELTGAHPVAADVCEEAGRQAIASACAEHLGALDLLLYAVGRADLRRLGDAGPEVWHATLEPNVVAWNRLVAAMLPVLAPGAIVAVLSSESAAAPRAGLVPYAASKAALEASVQGWRLEHPGLRFSVAAVGATAPTEFGHGFDRAALVPLLDDWRRHGVVQAATMDTAEVGRVLAGLYDAALANPSVGVERVLLRSPSDVV